MAHKDTSSFIVTHESWGDYHRLAIVSPAIAREARPGQFLMIRVNATPYPLLRRPFSVHFCQEDRVEIFFKVVGEGTALLAAKKPGDRLDLLGPLGRGFTLPGEPSAIPLWLVGGGRGIAPLRFLAHELRRSRQRPVIFYGGKSREDLPLFNLLQEEGFETRVATEDGSLGFRGLITELLEHDLQESRPVRLYVCGPLAMMRRVAFLAQELFLPAEFSLEARLGCGFGVCFGCVWRIRQDGREEWRRICQEGPVFPGEAIIWGEEP